MAGAEVVGRKTESNRLDSGSITYLAIKGRNRCAEFFEFAVRISATLCLGVATYRAKIVLNVCENKWSHSRTGTCDGCADAERNSQLVTWMCFLVVPPYA